MTTDEFKLVERIAVAMERQADALEIVADEIAKWRRSDPTYTVRIHSEGAGGP